MILAQNRALKITHHIKNKIFIPFQLVPKEGLTAEKLAFSITIGIVSGLFPVIGATTLVSVLLTVLFRQNLMIVQAVQWILGLAQVFLIIPFMQLGAFILNHHGLHITMHQISNAFAPGFLSGIKTVGVLHLYAIMTWSILAIPAGAISYFVFRTIFQKKKIKSEAL